MQANNNVWTTKENKQNTILCMILVHGKISLKRPQLGQEVFSSNHDLADILDREDLHSENVFWGVITYSKISRFLDFPIPRFEVVRQMWPAQSPR